MDTEENKEFVEEFNQYYTLKTNYENKYKKDKTKIIKDNISSWKEKRQEFKKLKPKCINCKRPVGTRFTQTYDNENLCTFFRAVCGSLSEPCDLNIELKLPQCEIYPDVIHNFQKDINDEKKNIINNKNKLIFGYINSEEAVGLFDEIKERIQDNSDLLTYYLEEYIDIVDNREKNEELKELIEKSYIIINDMKILIQKFDETNNNIQLVQDVVSIYINQLTPLLNEIREKKYSKNLVEYNEDTNTYHLIQEKNTLKDITFYHAKPEIISFQMGVVDKKSKRNIESQREKSKIQLVIEEEESEEEEEPHVEEEKEEHYDEEDDPDYQQIWKNLDEEYRQVLEKDPEWLKETMSAYVKAKKENKPIEFVLPTNIILPPIKMDNGKLDFGNETFNSAIDKLERMQREVILTFKPATMMETQLKKLLANKFKIKGYY